VRAITLHLDYFTQCTPDFTPITRPLQKICTTIIACFIKKNPILSTLFDQKTPPWIGFFHIKRPYFLPQGVAFLTTVIENGKKFGVTILLCPKKRDAFQPPFWS
jgi:hypothetical protein